MSIGDNIQFYRKKKNLTQKELADKLNVAVGTIQQYELDKREPKFSMIQKLALALSTNPYALYGIEKNASEFNFAKACDWLRDAGFELHASDEDDGLQQYEISDFENGTICKMDEIDIIDLVDECRKQAEIDTDEQTKKYIKIALLKR
jgi:transcriptional regulator with XRE-family HTH domain